MLRVFLSTPWLSSDAINWYAQRNGTHFLTSSPFLWRSIRNSEKSWGVNPSFSYLKNKYIKLYQKRFNLFLKVKNLTWGHFRNINRYRIVLMARFSLALIENMMKIATTISLFQIKNKKLVQTFFIIMFYILQLKKNI